MIFELVDDLHELVDEIYYTQSVADTQLYIDIDNFENGYGYGWKKTRVRVWVAVIYPYLTTKLKVTTNSVTEFGINESKSIIFFT